MNLSELQLLCTAQWHSSEFATLVMPIVTSGWLSDRGAVTLGELEPYFETLAD